MILLTGHTGYIGKILLEKLTFSGRPFRTLGRSENSDYIVDYNSDSSPFRTDDYFEQIIHIAGIAHQKQSDADHSFNRDSCSALGDYLLKLKKLPRQIIFISSVAVYQKTQGTNTTEEDFSSVSSGDPNSYAVTKLEAEKIIINFCGQHNINSLILRLPLVFGPKAPGNLGAMERAIKSGLYFRLSGIEVIKSVVYLNHLIQFLLHVEHNKFGIYNLVSENVSIGCIENYYASLHRKRILSLPTQVIKIIARLGDYFYILPINSKKYDKLTSSLTFSSEKAVNEIGWTQRKILGKTYNRY